MRYLSALEDTHEQASSGWTKIIRWIEVPSSHCSLASSIGEAITFLERLGSANPSPNLNTATGGKKNRSRGPLEHRAGALLFGTGKAVLKGTAS